MARGWGCVDCGGKEDWDVELDWAIVERELSVGLMDEYVDYWELLPFWGAWTVEFEVEEVWDDGEEYIWWVEDWEVEPGWWAIEGVSLIVYI